MDADRARVCRFLQSVLDDADRVTAALPVLTRYPNIRQAEIVRILGELEEGILLIHRSQEGASLLPHFYANRAFFAQKFGDDPVWRGRL